MKKQLKFIIFTFLMTGPIVSSYADFGFIQDKDGYVNVRGNSSLNSKVMTKLNNNEIVSCVMDEGTNNFCLVNASNGVTGFVYKNRINNFSGYTSIKLSQYSREKVVYSDKNIIVEVYAKKAILDPKLYKTFKGEYKYFNNKQFFGTDGSLPNNNFLQLDKIIIKDKDKKIEIGKNDIEQYFFPKNGIDGDKNELADFKIYYLNNNIYILNTFNNGGAAAYNIVLNVKNGKVVANKAWKVEI
ncbi:SH3 domain-containing protein [Acinetobacter nosocomialis]|uniref:SH3 domain-containing protein n=2 Tax=Acinetobacter nosocomialis TaxID=106654 RepID=A0A2L1VLM2_ACINO|nr:SH3 domain-containing protein [Acinetobacter nosocomialis]AVF46120.1 SH3 domain-containing protein [Acinetobacter nosocomialis]MBP1499908.1 SH3 domain-containing protein [Acinetobacter nosocomialis]MBR7685468.1 SH3 domain-containing protein [Acinetobacter nosocomialis]MBR7699502.1 SH3 domain-containing protein [Acinetobacter nosocomialis]MBR7749719.1 SH3 domain-containing protein [Acinetobacter nosocomialis]